MKSIADQNTGEMGGPGSVLSRQRRDHIELHRLLQQLAELPPRQQAPVLIEIYQLVFAHAFAEESVLWPVLRRVLPDGHELTLRVEREHQEINELVTRLESMDPGAAERAQVLDRVIALLLQDVRDEEDVLLPRLQAAVSGDRLRRIGLAWETVRRVAPTRPHPIVARRPPGNVLSALPLTLLDRTRDRLDKLRYRNLGTDSNWAKPLSDALAKAARAVEQVPGMRLGEDPSTRIALPLGQRWGTAALAVFAVAGGAMMLARLRR
jgi:hypothetical protein